MDKIAKILMKAIQSDVCCLETDLSELKDLSHDEKLRLYDFAKRYDLAHIVADIMAKQGLLGNDETSRKLKNQLRVAVLRHERAEQELAILSELLETAQIDFIPLKGSVLCRLYPEGWMRTRCDIDVLVKKGDLESAVSVIGDALKCTDIRKGSHDVSMKSQNGVNIEVHYSLLEEKRVSEAGRVLEKVWDYACSSQDGYRHKLNDEMFYYYHIVHIAKHIEEGGCGIRPLVDLWLLNNKSEYDEQNRNRLLEQGGLKKLESTLKTLCDVWFEDKSADNLATQLQDFILNSGLYGDISNHVTVKQSKKGGKLRYLMYRIWMPTEKLIYKYPVLEKHRFLMPLCQVRRWFGLIFNHRMKYGLKELKINTNVSAEQVNDVAKMFEELGI